MLCLHLSITMSACFQLISTQKIEINESKTLVTLSSQNIDGHIHYFHLTRNQVFALNDAFALLDRHCAYTDFPLGQNMWFHYNHRKSMIYDTTRYGESYFRFFNFQLYKRRIHKRVMFFLRSRSKPKASPNRGVKRLRVTCADDDDSCGESQTPNHQRPLSVVVRRTVESSKTEDSGTEQSTLHGATQDAVVSPNREACAVLPEWKNPSVGGQYDDFPFQATTHNDFSTPDCIQLSESSDIDSDSCFPMDCE